MSSTAAGFRSLDRQNRVHQLCKGMCFDSRMMPDIALNPSLLGCLPKLHHSCFRETCTCSHVVSHSNKEGATGEVWA